MSRYAIEQCGAKLLLMRGSFGMADIHFDGKAWRVMGYGFRNHVGDFPTLLSAVKGAIRSARAVFAEAGLHDR